MRKDSEKKPEKSQEKEPTSLALEVYKVLSDIISCLIFVVVLFVFGFRLVTVVGQSMYPTLHEGDNVTLMSNFIYEPQVGDIVVLKSEAYDRGPLVKRVIADEGQTVDIDFLTGEVWVDGELLQESYINEPTRRNDGTQFPLTVPEGCIFVMGDNRNHSSDSRDPSIGCVDKRYVLGKALSIVTPFSRFGGIE